MFVSEAFIKSDQKGEEMLKKICLKLSSIGIASFTVGAVLMMLFGMVDSKAAVAAVGLSGVIIGSVVSAGALLLTARENRKQQWALAALDKRLEVHQAAYSLWQRIVRAIYDEEKIDKIIHEAEDWWNNNCLYLDVASRQAFRACLLYSSSHSDLLKDPRDKESVKMIKESWATIMKPGQTLPAGVSLPGLSEQELSPTPNGPDL